jgi:hypothetical protein
MSSKDILIYNGFPFHYEMIGCMLEYCKKNDIHATLVNKCENEEWLHLYKQKFSFTDLSELPCLDVFNLIVLLTDDDMTFPDSFITYRTVCIDHYYLNRRPSISHHLPISPFYEGITQYVFPVFSYISYEEKLTLVQRPILTFLGDATLPPNRETFKRIENIEDFDIYIINRSIGWKDYRGMENVYLFENIGAREMFSLLSKTTYLCYIPNSCKNAGEQSKNRSISACFPLSFTTGCILVFPETINTFLRLESPITYTSSIRLETKPCFKKTFEERERLLSIADTTINSTLDKDSLPV